MQAENEAIGLVHYSIDTNETVGLQRFILRFLEVLGLRHFQMQKAMRSFEKGM